MKQTLLTCLTVALMSLNGCSTFAKKSPDLFPNEKYTRTSPEKVRTDVDYCQSLADEYVQQPDKFTNVAKRGLIGGAVGAGAGAVGGAIYGNAGRGTAAGAAIGGIIGVLQGLMEVSEDSPSYQRFVEYCLQKKGYEITGWSAK